MGKEKGAAKKGANATASAACPRSAEVALDHRGARRWLAEEEEEAEGGGKAELAGALAYLRRDGQVKGAFALQDKGTGAHLAGKVVVALAARVALVLPSPATVVVGGELQGVLRVFTADGAPFPAGQVMAMAPRVHLHDARLSLAMAPAAGADGCSVAVKLKPHGASVGAALVRASVWTGFTSEERVESQPVTVRARPP
eukprot:602102-Pyramimonas_sp.AAC.1